MYRLKECDRSGRALPSYRTEAEARVWNPGARVWRCACTRYHAVGRRVAQ